MGSSYSNITLHGPDRDRIIQALQARGRQAYVGPEANGCVVVFDEQSGDDPELGAELAAELTRELGGSALAAMIHDDDIFLYSLVRGGQVVDEYNSCPGYFEGDDTPPTGGDARLLAEVFGSGDPGTVERILHAPAKQGDYFFETRRHADFAEALGLPEHSVGLGFGYIYQGEADEVEPELEMVGFSDDEEAGAPGNQMELMRARLSRSEVGREVLAQAEAFNAAAQGPAHGYFRALLAGDAAALRALFAGSPALDDPLSGRVEGDGIDAHAAAAQTLFAGAKVTYTPEALLETPERVVSRGQIIGRGQGGQVGLPCACVWERGEGGGFRELRAYWSPAGMKQQRGERPPVLEPREGLPLPAVISTHLQALAADDLEGVMATYLEMCLAPIPWLDPADTVRRHYGAQLGNDGAVVLSPCTVTQTAGTCAVEFVTTRWDGAEIPPQAGLAVYDLREGYICQTHLYGDLAPSPMAGLEALGGLPGLGDPALPPEARQQAMEQVMQMMNAPGGLAGMMDNLQKMMEGMQGMPGADGFGFEGMEGSPDLNALFGGFAAGRDEDDDGADEAADDEEPDASDPSADKLEDGAPDGSGNAPK
jgi:hypothetical protein